MYTKNKNKLANKINIIIRYFDDIDVTDSLLLKLLPTLDSYDKLLVSVKRYDLLADKVYGDPMLGWVLQFYTGIQEQDLVLHSYIPYPSLNDVKTLIMSLDEYNE